MFNGLKCDRKSQISGILTEPLNQRGAAVVHLNFRAGSTFLVPVCTVSPGYWVNRTSRWNKVDVVIF